MKKITKFQRFTYYFNLFINKEVTRKELLNALENGKVRETKTDHYRKAAELAGYIERVKLGVYKSIKEIPLTMTWYKLQQEAYPNRTK